jgi:hypothetical protein
MRNARRPRSRINRRLSLVELCQHGRYGGRVRHHRDITLMLGMVVTVAGIGRLCGVWPPLSRVRRGLGDAVAL